MHAASADPRAELIEMPHLNHYLVDQPDGITRIIGHLRRWLVERALAS